MQYCRNCCSPTQMLMTVTSIYAVCGPESASAVCYELIFKARKKIPVFPVARPTLPNGRRSVNFRFFDFCLSCQVLHPEPFRSISVNSVTAADVFQTLETSVCVIVDFLQNGDRHSPSHCEKNVPISWAFTSSDPIPILCPCAVFGCSTTVIHDIQLTLAISNSLISNNCLSRSVNLVPAYT